MSVREAMSNIPTKTTFKSLRNAVDEITNITQHEWRYACHIAHNENQYNINNDTTDPNIEQQITNLLQEAEQINNNDRNIPITINLHNDIIDQ